MKIEYALAGKNSGFTIKYRKIRGESRRRLPSPLGKLIENRICPGGGIGRRVGLKIRLELNPVPVQVWPRAVFKRTQMSPFFVMYFVLLRFIKNRL